MTAAMIDHMENTAYELAIRDQCIDTRDSQKVAMHELFDMISGVESGAIIASSLLIKNDDEKTKD